MNHHNIEMNKANKVIRRNNPIIMEEIRYFVIREIFEFIEHQICWCEYFDVGIANSLA